MHADIHTVCSTIKHDRYLHLSLERTANVSQLAMLAASHVHYFHITAMCFSLYNMGTSGQMGLWFYSDSVMNVPVVLMLTKERNHKLHGDKQALNRNFAYCCNSIVYNVVDVTWLKNRSICRKEKKREN